MTTLAINDLHTERALDRKAMSSIRGAGGAGWVFGWIRPYIPAVASSDFLGPVMNFFQTNNFYIADQMNNQFQTIDINSTGANARISVAPELVAVNVAH